MVENYRSEERFVSGVHKNILSAISPYEYTVCNLIDPYYNT